MNSEDFLDTVRHENETALSRLGSSKSLYAATAGEMEAEPVLTAAAAAERAAAETFADWADDEAEAESVQDAFEAVAAEEQNHYEMVLEKLDDEPAESVSALHEHLRDLDDSVERVGGFLGRTLASDKSKEQMTGFFVGNADPQTAQLFRDLRGDLDGQLERGLSLLETLCENDGDCERAETAASSAIQAAYEEYTESLESMGVNPKPVC